MKTYLKLITAFLVIGLCSAKAQESSQLTPVQAATKALVDSVPKDDKAATLKLLAEACKEFPDEAANVVAALIKAIGDYNASSDIITKRNAAMGIQRGQVNPVIVGEIVSTAINAVPAHLQNSILTVAQNVATYATTQLNLVGTNPLTYISTQGLAGTSLNPATFNQATTPASKS